MYRKTRLKLFRTFLRTSAHPKALKINLLFSKNADGQAFRSAEVQKSSREFLYVLNLKPSLSSQ